jgi:hypothetical protein
VPAGGEKVTEADEDPADAEPNQAFGQKKILRAESPKDCTLFRLVLKRFSRHHHVPVHLTPSGRSSDSRITLLSEPSHNACASQWLYRISSPFTAAGPLPNLTGFPFKLTVPDGYCNCAYFEFAR